MVEITDSDLRELMADLLFNQAVEFHESCKLLNEYLDQSKNHSHVIFVDSLFGAELYLKSILYAINTDPPRTHSLKTLWQKFPENIKQEIWDCFVSQEQREETEKIFNLAGEIYNSQRYIEGCYFDDTNFLLGTLDGLNKYGRTLDLPKFSEASLTS